jgi:hypothetical protein
LLFVGGLSITAFTRALIAQEVRFRNEPLPGPDTLRFVTSFSSNALGLVTIPFATIAVAAASVMILQLGVMARWLGWLGVGVTVLSAVAIVLLRGPLAIPLILVWVLGASVLLFRNPATQEIVSDSAPGIAPAGAPYGMT